MCKSLGGPKVGVAMIDLQIAADLVTAFASLVAVVIAWRALTIARETFRRDHRPVLRVVGVKDRTEPSYVPATGSIIVKNLGLGPAFTLIVFNPDLRLSLGEADSLEPLQPADSETKRIGRIVITLSGHMSRNVTYELYCQDLLSHWHLTRFRPRQFGMECTFVGQIGDSQIPKEIRGLASVTRDHKRSTGISVPTETEDV